MSAQTTPSLEAQSRTLVGKQVSSFRKNGQVPAVVYGHSLKSLSIVLDEKSFLKLYREAGSTTLVELAIDGAKSHKVIIHDIQIHPTRNRVLHVDLYQVNMKEKLKTEVPLEFEGTAPVVELEGGTLITVKDAIEIECLPEDLVQHLSIDVASLVSFDDVIRVSDLKVPKGVVILTDPEDVLMSVSAPRSQEEIDALEETDTTSVAEVESETTSGTDTTPEKEDSSKS